MRQDRGLLFRSGHFYKRTRWTRRGRGEIFFFRVSGGDAGLEAAVGPVEEQFVPLVAAGAVDKGRPEARQAARAFAPDAGVDDAVGALREKETGQGLRRGVALGNGLG